MGELRPQAYKDLEIRLLVLSRCAEVAAHAAGIGVQTSALSDWIVQVQRDYATAIETARALGLPDATLPRPPHAAR